jgi:two-component system, OmpR family, phosphate regulon sensor histidine kinase PhoR
VVRIRKKIFAYYVILIFIGIIITGFFFSQFAQRLYKHEVEERLKICAVLIRQQISGNISEGIEPDYDNYANTYAKLIGQNPVSSIITETSQFNIRITFINFDGNVLGESETDYRNMENHGNRKEVIEAVEGRTGRDIRYSRTLAMNFLYVAIPLMSERLVVRVSVPLTQLGTINRAILYYTLIGILAGLFITTLLALRFSSSVISPIKQLTYAAKDISQGNYSKRVTVTGKNELGDLAYTFNSMANELEKTVFELTDKNIKVNSIMNSITNGVIAVDSSDNVILINSIACKIFGIGKNTDMVGSNILEVIRNNHIIRFMHETINTNTSMDGEIYLGPPEDIYLKVYANPIKLDGGHGRNTGAILTIHDITKIKKLELIRTEFVSNVTHELKTPLTSIRGFIETLKDGAIQDKKVAEKFLQIIDIEAERLYMLISDILQLSEIESKNSDDNIKTHVFEDIMVQILPILTEAARKKNIKIEYDIQDNLKITANSDRIKQMLINLIDNAIKYNIENGKVVISAYRSEGRLTIIVKDSGIGISKEHLPRIFERFYRVDKGRSKSMGGTGLGLSIVKHIVNLYNGDINVKSTPYEGTEFVVKLPL